jgi:hypothetical protein
VVVVYTREREREKSEKEGINYSLKKVSIQMNFFLFISISPASSFPSRKRLTRNMTKYNNSHFFPSFVLLDRVKRRGKRVSAE